MIKQIKFHFCQNLLRIKCIKYMSQYVQAYVLLLYVLLNVHTYDSMGGRSLFYNKNHFKIENRDFENRVLTIKNSDTIFHGTTKYINRNKKIKRGGRGK